MAENNTEKINIDVTQKQECFSGNHTFFSGFENIGNNTSRTVFEDNTKNHNKVTLVLVSNGGALDIKIKTRGKNCDRVISAIVPATSVRNFLVEDFKSLEVSNNSGVVISFQFGILKEFCICCNDECSYGDCHKKDQNKNNENAQCFVGNEDFFFFQPIPGNTLNLPLFENFTKNHSKTNFIIAVTNPIQVIIRTRGEKDCDRPIIATIPTGGTRAFQIEDFKSLEVSNDSAIPSSFTITVQNSICICCKDGKHKKLEDECESEHEHA
ncbi:hypothetical protein [Peribacillus huizhouensis]|uniref:DNA-binding protein n=1 Tax=Peribacillus huizhouensis TaxID=1501239 RepID=A0ABR6CMK2_9BACI|nr:hypothetical protein [Peribacillus huizhouensis]MBA9026264.1 DNA-binding protein [Peribacillus huizhouensis]